MSNNVTCFKLVNGHEIIGCVTGESQDKYIIEDATHLFAEPTQEGNLGMRFVPLTFFAKDKPMAKPDTFFVDITLDARHVLFSYTPKTEVEKSYLSAKSTIILAK